MSIILCFFLVIVSIAVHEWGHFIEMIKAGVPVKKFSIGIPIRGIPYFRFRIKCYKEVSFEIHPLIIGGFVQTKQNSEEENLGYIGGNFINALRIISNGPLYSILFGLVLMVLAKIIGSLMSIISLYQLTSNLVFVGVCLFAGSILYVFRDFIFKFIFPSISIILLFCLIFLFITKSFNFVHGPIAVGKMICDLAHTPSKAIFLAGLISISIGLFNLLPLGFLDGGDIFLAILKKYKASELAMDLFYGFGNVMFVLLMGIILWNDIFS